MGALFIPDSGSEQSRKFRKSLHPLGHERRGMISQVAIHAQSEQAGVSELHILSSLWWRLSRKHRLTSSTTFKRIVLPSSFGDEARLHLSGVSTLMLIRDLR